MTFDHDVVEFIGLLALVVLLCFAAYAHAARAEVINPFSCADLAEAVKLVEAIPEPNVIDLATLRKLREWQRAAGCPMEPEC